MPSTASGNNLVRGTPDRAFPECSGRRPPLRRLLFFLFLPLLLMPFFIGACASPFHASRYPAGTVIEIPEGVTGGSTQALIVTEEGSGFFKMNMVYAVQKQADRWLVAFEPCSAVVGRNGFAPAGEKREGDGRTPSGMYRLSYAFGYAPAIGTKMPYRQALADDLWVDDPGAPDYNRWVRRSETSAGSYEKMKRDDGLYKYGVVVEYNTDPVARGLGSAIFFHIWKGSHSTTSGCVAVSEENMLGILAWLNPEANPVIIINPGPMIPLCAHGGKRRRVPS